MSSIEKENGVHSCEKAQADRTKSKADQYVEHSKINWDMCDSNKVIDVSKKITVLAGKNDGMF